MSESISYSEAVAELDAILAEIEGEDVDVDRLAVRVTRAADLIKVCRQRIHDTQMEVEEIVAGIEVTPPDEDDDEPASEPHPAGD